MHLPTPCHRMGWGVPSWEGTCTLWHTSQHVRLHCHDKCQQHARLDEQKQSQWVANTQYSVGHNFGYTPSSFGSPNTLSKLNLIWWKARKMRGLEHVRRGWEKWLCTAWTSESSGEAYLTRWYLRGYQERMSRPFTGVHGRRNRDSCHSLKQVGFWFGTCK